jgi:hypothetical protein
MDLRNKEEYVLTYLFDNGSEKILKLPPADFFNDILYKAIPYNSAFLSQCEIIRLF